MEVLFNKLLFRISIGFIVGLPITYIIAIITSYGLFIGYMGAHIGAPMFILAGIFALLGVVGTLGAWLRIIKTSTSMSNIWRGITRLMLLCGVVSASSLSIVLFLNELGMFGFMLLVISAGGIAFVYATPKISNN